MLGETRARFRIIAIECDCPVSEREYRVLAVGQASFPVNACRPHQSKCEPRVTSGKGWVEINGLLKELLRESVVVSRPFAEMP